jgi:hypothetical protein
MVVYFDLSKTTAVQIHNNFDATGTLAATVALATSNYLGAPKAIYSQGVAPRWEDESSVTFAALTSGEGGQMVHVGNLGAKWGKLTITRTGGTGDVAILVNGKE